MVKNIDIIPDSSIVRRTFYKGNNESINFLKINLNETVTRGTLLAAIIDIFLAKLKLFEPFVP